jgi:hypothetical protein
MSRHMKLFIRHISMTGIWTVTEFPIKQFTHDVRLRTRQSDYGSLEAYTCPHGSCYAVLRTARRHDELPDSQSQSA